MSGRAEVAAKLAAGAFLFQRKSGVPFPPSLWWFAAVSAEWSRPAARVHSARAAGRLRWLSASDAHLAQPLTSSG